MQLHQTVIYNHHPSRFALHSTTGDVVIVNGNSHNHKSLDERINNTKIKEKLLFNKIQTFHHKFYEFFSRYTVFIQI